AHDGQGNTYVAGVFQGTVNFDPGVGTCDLTSAGGNDAFVAKYDSQGALVWARQAGSSGSDQGFGVAVDSSGNVFVTGTFSGTPASAAGRRLSDSLTATGSPEAFVWALDSTGTTLWARDSGCAHGAFAIGSGIAVDSSGNVLVTGNFKGTASFAAGSG